MKLKHNPSITKDIFETLSDLFGKVFRLNPEERITIDEITKYKFLPQVKGSSPSLSTESSSGDEEMPFEAEKVLFVESILQRVKSLKFLSGWEETTFEYYIKKISLSLLDGVSSNESRMKVKEIQHTIDKLGHYLSKNMK